MKGSLVILFLALGFAPPLPSAAQEQVLQWRRWEATLTSARDYSGGNPYHDLVLRVVFQRDNPALRIAGAGFWDGGRTFKIRAALPPGTWRWSTTCTGTTGGRACDRPDRDPGLWRSGTFRVLPDSSPDAPEIYRRGFLRVAAPGTERARFLTYDDGTPFFWLGDTAWQAPVAATPEPWAAYLADRRRKGFTVVQMAPATQYEGAITSFEPVGDCPGPATPNPCSRWMPAFWRNLDELVERANRAGLVVVLAGLINPVGRGGTKAPELYPAPEDAAIFARNVAARLAGNFVIFSPGFDDRIDTRVSRGATVRDAMQAVGEELARTVPRHLAANHLAGASPVSDYQVFQGQGWLSFQLFQSGHARNLAACEPGETRQRCAVRRARELPLGLWTLSPTRPTANGEGGYESPLDPAAAPPDNRYGARQTAYSSLLSGAFGFTLGVQGIYSWEDPARVLNSPGSFDMARLGLFFRVQPWQDLVPAPERVLDGGSRSSERVISLAATPAGDLALAYLPDGETIMVDTRDFPGLDCGPAWSKLWLDPRTGVTSAAEACTPGPGRISLARPACQDPSSDVTGGCDWLLALRNTGAAMSANSMAQEAGARAGTLQVWAAPDSTGTPSLASTIRARLFGPDGKLVRDGIVVSPGGRILQTAPAVARDARGGFFVVWQTSSPASLFARRFDAQGRPLGGVFRVSPYTRGDQTGPAVTADGRGRVIVAWTSRGGLFAQRFDTAGERLGSVIRLNAHTHGNPSAPRLMADARGHFVAAWESEGQGVVARLFDRWGRPRSPEIRVSPAGAGDPVLTALTVLPDGRFSIRWAPRSRPGVPRAPVEQWFDRAGRRVQSRE